MVMCPVSWAHLLSSGKFLVKPGSLACGFTTWGLSIGLLICECLMGP